MTRIPAAPGLDPALLTAFRDPAMPSRRSASRRLLPLGLLLAALGGCGSGDLYQGSGTQAFDPTSGENGGGAPEATPDELLTVEVLGMTNKPASVSDDQDPSAVAFRLPAVAIVPGDAQELTVEVVDAVGRSVQRTVLVSVSP